ncbi:type II toxin-antitoxin system HicB family antitoxin [Escherichia coli]
MRYPVTLTPAPEGGYMVSFVDIPEALTQGETVAEALTQGETVAEAMEAAKDALLTAFDFYFEDNELIPLPSPLNSHDHFIEVPLSVASKVLLLNAFLQSEITQQELARRIGKPKQEITRLFNLHHATKIDAVQLAAKALGKELSLVMV